MHSQGVTLVFVKECNLDISHYHIHVPYTYITAKGTCRYLKETAVTLDMRSVYICILHVVNHAPYIVTPRHHTRSR